MNWSVFWGSVAGSIIGIIVLLGAIALIIWLYDRSEPRKQGGKQTKTKTSASWKPILEKHLEEIIIENFETLFPEWEIYNYPNSISTSQEQIKPSGVRLSVDSGEIDLLCLDSEKNFVVIELKRNKASDKAAAQIDRYISWVERNLAMNGETVRGIIIARYPDKHLAYTLSRRPDVEFWTYAWTLNFDKDGISNSLD